jgi:molybdate transport system ATP-binding protein
MNLEVAIRKRAGTFALQAEFALTGARVGIFGPSGSGKSTLMHLLAGLMQPESGHIRLNGTTLFDSARGINLRPEERRIGVVFQDIHLFPHMNVRRNLLYGRKRAKTADPRIDMDRITRILGIAGLLDRDIHMLSGGERQRVALARTMLACPRLILMDEPLSGLDAGLKMQIIPYLVRVFAECNMPLLFISHSLLEMRLMTDTVLVMDQGRIGQQLPTGELARPSWNSGHLNLIKLGRALRNGTLNAYQWGETRLILTNRGDHEENMYTLDSREIILCQRHPRASSARNILDCRVERIYPAGNRVLVDLQCSGNSLTAQVDPESVQELGLREGSAVVAAIKASAFAPLCDLPACPSSPPPARPAAAA